MRSTLNAQCERFIDNRDIVKSVFRWESGYVIPACAACFGRDSADKERLRQVAALLKEETGIFSPFRGFARPVICAMVSREADPEAALNRTLHMYQALRACFSSSTFLPLAAVALARLSANPEETARRARQVYDCMKRDHFFLTSSEDSVFAALLALSEFAPEEAERRSEACFARLRGSFSRTNGVQTLSHVLALAGGSPEDRCANLEALYETLRRAGLKFGQGMELPVLGALSLLEAEPVQLAADLRDVDDFLAAQKGYGVFGPGRAARRMHAAMILMDEAEPALGGDVSGTAAGLAGVYAAQQAAMMAAVAASASASAAAASSN